MNGRAYLVMPDEQLDEAIKKLEAKCRALRLGQTAVAARLYQHAADALDQARAEERRRGWGSKAPEAPRENRALKRLSARRRLL